MKTYKTKGEVLEQAVSILERSLRDIIPQDKLNEIESTVNSYSNRRKGLLGELVEQFVFGLNVNNRAEADFNIAGIELKTNPLKRHDKKKYVSKERLVFSMINYDEVVHETWETSSFLKKNKLLLLMFYLWLQDQSILDHEFKFIRLFDLLHDVSDFDAVQIRDDWQFIVNKIKRGEAHLLSEADTYYLGACTKAKSSKVVRDQPRSRVPAKPRAFSFKQQYLNYLIQRDLLGNNVTADSIFKKERHVLTVEKMVAAKFRPYLGKTDSEIAHMIGWGIKTKPKNYKRLLTNRILGVRSNRIEELEKANITLKAVVLEPNSKLKESISFPAFDFSEVAYGVWYDEEKEEMSTLLEQLETRKFLFVVFRKQSGKDTIILEKVFFWNFPMTDLPKAQDVWEKTSELIREGKIVKNIKKGRSGKEIRETFFPGSTYNGVVHVRPHGQNKKDVSTLPVPDIKTGANEYTKQCFWLNAEYIQRVIQDTLGI